MPWSTRELAELAGVSLRAIRHWHDLGLLPAPARRANGYKEYTGQHLVLVLRIKRLTALGFGLERVAEIIDHERSSENAPAHTSAGEAHLTDLRSELDARIAELTRVRAEVDAILRDGGPPDLAPPAAALYGALRGGQVTPVREPATGAGPDDSVHSARVNRDLAVVLGHLTPTHYISAIADTLTNLPPEMHSLEREVMRLPADASESEITQLSTVLTSAMRAFVTEHPNHAELAEIETGPAVDTPLVTELAFEQLNGAQRQVMSRVISALSDLG